jgi:hypothetical protein
MFEMADIFVALVSTQMTVYILFIGQFVDLNDFVVLSALFVGLSMTVLRKTSG